MCTCAKRRRQGTSNWNARAFCPCPLVLTAGGALGGFASMALLACLAWFVVTRRRAADQIGLVSSTMQAVVMQAAHPPPGGGGGGGGGGSLGACACCRRAWLSASFCLQHAPVATS